MFHSRRIGLHNGKTIRIIGGVRFVGRLGDWDIGFLDMQTEKSDELPSENFGVLRIRKQIFNEFSSAGGMLTSRLGDDGSYNLAYGLDSKIRLFGDEYLKIKIAQTIEEELPDGKPFNFLDATTIRAIWERRRQEGLNYQLAVNRTGVDYNPGMGFSTRQNFTEFNWSVSHDWILDSKSMLRQVSPIQFFGFIAMRNDDKTIESAQFEYDTDFIWKSGAGLWADFEAYYDDLKEPLSFSDNIKVPIGTYNYYNFEGGYYTGSGNLFRYNFNVGLGSFYDGWRTVLGGSATWNLSKHLELNFVYNVNFLP